MKLLGCQRFETTRNEKISAQQKEAACKGRARLELIWMILFWMVYNFAVMAEDDVWDGVESKRSESRDSEKHLTHHPSTSP